MNKKIFSFIVLLIALILPSCNQNKMSYNYVDPDDIVTIQRHNINLIENDFIKVAINKRTANTGEYINLQIEDIKDGYLFLGWYINDVYRGEAESLNIQVFNDIKIETKYVKTEKVSRVGFSVGGQIIRNVYTDYSLILTKEILDSVLSFVGYLPYGYEIVGWNDLNGKEFKEGDIVSDSVVLYPVYEIHENIKQFEYNIDVVGGEVINADTFDELNGKKSYLGTILTFTAYDEEGKIDNSKAWVDSNGEVYSYKSSFTMTLVNDLQLHTVDKSSLDTTQPILQSSTLFIERKRADTQFEYLNLRLMVRVIIPLDYEYYDIMKNYGAKMERESSDGHRQRATFSLNKSQWSINGEAWCGANSQSVNYKYSGSAFVELEDVELGEKGSFFNTSGWKKTAVLSIEH